MKVYENQRKEVVWIMAIAGAMSAAAFAADREVKVDDRLDASADALTDMMRASVMVFHRI
jgi:hypothetical protein